jgi:hypothetical protein
MKRTDNLKKLESFMKHVTILTFIEKITPDKNSLEDVYANRLMMFYVDNSDSKQQTNDKGFVYNNGILQDVESINVSKISKGFELTEIDFITYELEYLKNYLEVEKLKISEKKQFEMYVNFLKSKVVNSGLAETNKPDEVKKELHKNIFKGNAFELFEKYFINKNITGSSATDLRLLFELMKNDNFLIETIELKHYIKWLNRIYFDGNLITLKKIYSNTNPNIQRTKDYNEYKDNLKITLK